MSMVCNGQTIESLSYRIQFDRSSSVVDPYYKENAYAFSCFARDLDSLRRIPEVEILDITAKGSASWEGDYEKNLHLCDKRVLNVTEYLKSKAGVEVLQVKPYPFVDEFIDIILECDSEYREGVLAILGSCNDDVRKVKALMALDSGRCWAWLNTEIFSYQRRVDLEIRYIAHEMQAAPAIPLELQTVPRTYEDVQTIDNTAVDTTRCFFFAIKNNLLYDMAMVANLGLEFGFGKHFTVDIPVTYSPYTICSAYRMRILSVQPDLRYYLKKGWCGHFFGIHGNFAYYNVVTPFNTKTRFQDRDGKHPLYGGGISYGYSLPFRKDGHWGIEFTIGAGYAYLDYDCFYNVDNGAWFTKDTKHYFGVDKAGVTIYYRIFDRKRKK